MEKTLVLLLLVLFAVASAQKGKMKIDHPNKDDKSFSWSVKPLTEGGKVNGISGSGIWKPRDTDNKFTGTGSWQNGKGFGGSLKGTFGIGKGSSFSIGVGGGGGKKFKAKVGFKIAFRRKRRSALVREMFHI